MYTEGTSSSSQLHLFINKK